MLAAILLAGLALSSCPLSAQEQTVTLTTARAAGEELTLLLNKATGLSVDWGDGTFVPVERGESEIIEVTGKVLGPTVVVKGGSSLTLLGCASCGLTSLDASGAPQLRSLYCQNNELSSLDITGLAELTDLNCANNALTELALGEAAYPVLETVNVSGNRLGGTFVIRQDKLQYIDVSDNEFTRVYANSDPSLNVLICSNNKLSGSLSLNTNVSNLSAVVCHGNALTGITVNSGSGLPSLRTLICDDNGLKTLNLSQSEGLAYLSCQRNSLASVSLHAKARPSAFHCGDNSLTFSSFPSVRPEAFSADPQSDIDISGQLGLLEGGYLYMRLCPSYAERNDYALDLDAYRRDASGLTAVQFSCIRVEADGSETELERGTSSSAPKDYSNTSGKLAFFNAAKEVYVRMTHTRYPGFALRTIPFAVCDPDGDLTGIGRADASGGLSASVEGGRLLLSSPSAQEVRVYSVDGRPAWTGRVGAEPVVVSLPRGVYVVNGRKVAL